jgi:hypothetical protein
VPPWPRLFARWRTSNSRSLLGEPRRGSCWRGEALGLLMAFAVRWAAALLGGVLPSSIA